MKFAGWTADLKIVGGFIAVVAGAIVTFGPNVVPALPPKYQAAAGAVILLAGYVATALGNLKKG